MKMWLVVHRALPPSPYGGPPLPRVLNIEWPSSVKRHWPTWAFTLSQKVAVLLDDIEHKLGK